MQREKYTKYIQLNANKLPIQARRELGRMLIVHTKVHDSAEGSIFNMDEVPVGALQSIYLYVKYNLSLL